MKNNLLRFLLAALLLSVGLQSRAQLIDMVGTKTFTYTYEGLTVEYTVYLSSNTCSAKGIYETDNTDRLILPAHPVDEDGVSYTLTMIEESGFTAATASQGGNSYGPAAKPKKYIEIPATVTSIGMNGLWCISPGGTVVFRGCPSVDWCALGLVTPDDDSSSSRTLNLFCYGGMQPSFEENAIIGVDSLMIFYPVEEYSYFSAFDLFPNYAWASNCKFSFQNEEYPNVFYYEYNGLTYACNATTLEATLVGNHYESMTEVTIPECFAKEDAEGVEGMYYVKRIGKNAFKDCKALETVTLPGQLREMGESAFSGCSKISEITFPSTLERIEDHAFYRTAISSIDLPHGLKYLSGFDYVNLSGLDIPPTVTEIGNSAFIATNLLSNPNIVIPNSVEKIGESAFADNNLSSVKFSGVLNEIGKSAFANNRLTEVVIPSSIETIGESAFANNATLATVKIGHGLKNLKSGAFRSCNDIKDIYVTAPVPPAAIDNAFEFNVLDNANLWVHHDDVVGDYEESLGLWYYFIDRTSAVENPITKAELASESIVLGVNESKKLQVTVEPENATLPHVFFKSSNPAIATVDHDGVITVHSAPEIQGESAEYYDPAPCVITAMTMHPEISEQEFTVVPTTATTSISEVTTDNTVDVLRSAA